MKRIAFLFAMVPNIGFSATIDTSKGFSGFVELIVDLAQNIIYFISALVVVVFLWGVLRYWIAKGGDADAVKEGRDFIIAGIIGIVVMFSVWGLVRILKMTFFGG